MKINSGYKNIILYISTFPPRECGIATFTQDLSQAMNQRFNPISKSQVVAINESQTSFYNYSDTVLDQIAGNELKDYVSLAEKINKNDNVKIVNIQHEFGIFGGNCGDYIIPFLQVLEKPTVVTFHSVLPNPVKHIRKLVNFISENSNGIIVMNQRSKDLLEKQYQIPQSKIFLIPHGIPNTTFDASEKLKLDHRLQGKTVLSTFGLLGPDKGIEYVIRALPKILKKYPNVIYLVLGATHPVLRKRVGEEYRNFLIDECERLRLKDHVKFYNKYLALDEIIRYLKITDIYLSPCINPRQSVSGTLSYALGCGRPVISTATEYAKYLIQKNCGALVPCKNSRAMSKTILKLLDNKKLLDSMGKSAFAATRHMIWPNVAGSYFDVYKKFADIDIEERKLPKIKLDHLIQLTNNFGLIQHARYDKPYLKFGYSTDDNSRALIFCAHYYKYSREPLIADLMKKYLKYMAYVQAKDGCLSNIVNEKRQPDHTKVDDVQGRGIWALGYILSLEYLPEDIIKPAKKLFKKILRTLKKIQAPRARSFAMIGLYYFLKRFPNRILHRGLYVIFKKFAESQVKLFKEIATHDWQWYEDKMTYSNSKLSECLFYAYDLTKNKKYLAIAETSLDFLSKITFEKNQYAPIGQNGWYFKNNSRSYFDQQPEDTASMVQTKIAAYKITGDKHQLRDAFIAFQWFLGKNHLKQMVYNEATGGCHDGIGQYSLNLNQGAESTLSYLMARLGFEDPSIMATLEKI